jgi:hypothetical protein
LRIAPFAAVALACALAGALLALGLANAVGWAGSDSTTTVFRSSPLPPAAGQASPVAVGPSVKPLIGNGFNPKAIYARRSPGVVTIVAVYGTDPATAEKALGSGIVISPKGFIVTNHMITTAGDARSRSRPTRSTSSSRITIGSRRRSSAGTSSTMSG